MADTNDLGLNRPLIGVDGARQRLATPALLLDLDALEHNIATMAAFCRNGQMALRPHAKTHKSLNVARMQIEAGAVGVCVATVREAIVMVGGGIPNVHVTTPVIGAAKVDALCALLDAGTGLSAVVDSMEGLEELEASVRRHGRTLPVLVDVDMRAMYRTGAATEEDAIALAQRIARSDAFDYAGIQYYSGIIQHVPKLADRGRLYNAELDRLRRLIRLLEKANLKPRIVSGGGTGTFPLDSASGLFTENQAGSYVVMDVEYGAVELGPNADTPFRNALFVQSTVISNNAHGLVTTDAGSKSFATDGPPPQIAHGAPATAAYHYFGDEFGMIVFERLVAEQGQADAPSPADGTYGFFHRAFDQLPGGARQLALGTKVELVVPHCDPTVNLHNYYHCMRGDRLEDIWPVDARGSL